ncbi:FliI/YscN family ATPase [Salmonella enterica]|uniref:FliI/YscN family ATPase n=1 Tax=Salmonella enterica TaxID=28901 RepID=UPI001280E6CF|nr:FliI/YscN family ATPase [Salmonella enterica subsp. diarizonae]EDF9557384.1 FliI/YscN family ATPase [Salmonella enterica]EDQ1112845.1 FliI/YscN family ATPase [Salmonella enterica subsp. diarizonae]EEP1781605.1 FliI/YscN family ATPase [Salmonella enterica]EGQ1238804.1 FliI/YscN family ATPase [Salmonella enterica]
MRKPDIDKLITSINATQMQGKLHAPRVIPVGYLTEVNTTVLKAYLPWAHLGELCYIGAQRLLAEVVSLQDGYACLSLFDIAVGLRCGTSVVASGAEYQIAVGDFLLGKTLDGLGRLPNSSDIPYGVEYRPLESAPPDPMERALIEEILPVGVRAIDATLTCGRGQRLGIFAAAGGGKSTLLSMLCDGVEADVIVLALVGERGREVREFLEYTLSDYARSRCVTVVATSERAALERLKASFVATTIAEYFRDQGKNVVLMIDSLTRYARAAREVGLSSGEPASGFPPSVFATLPRLLERAGNGKVGSITAFYTVLVEGDNMNEPIADEVRSILDGHIVLSRKLAEANHYPAIDVSASVSRVMRQIVTSEHMRLAGHLRTLIALYREIELLVRVGEYREGQDPDADKALRCWPVIQQFLQQAAGNPQSLSETLELLKLAVE